MLFQKALFQRTNRTEKKGTRARLLPQRHPRAAATLPMRASSFSSSSSFRSSIPFASSSSVVFNRTKKWISKRVVRNDAFPNDDDEKEDNSRGDDEEKEENVQQIDVRDDAALAKIGLKWNDDYTELLDGKTGKPLDDFEELQRKQQKASRFDIAVRAMRGEFTKARGKTEGEVYGEIMDTLTRYPIVYTFQASAKVSEAHDVLRVRQQIKETVETRCQREAIEVEIKPRGKKFHSFWVKISVSDSREVSECIDLLKDLDDVVTCC